MYRYVYKLEITEGDLKGYYYYGKHTTDNLDDGYKSSSTILHKLKYFDKYPNGYKMHIIKLCMTDEEQTELENELIRKYKREDKCLNCINTSSSGGNITNWTPEKIEEIKRKKQDTWHNKSEEEMRIHNEKCAQPGEKNPMWGKNYRDFMTEEAAKERDRKWYNTMMSKSPEEKAEINKKRGKGGKTHKDTIIISNTNTTKRIKQEELQYYLNLGYERGFKKNINYRKK